MSNYKGILTNKGKEILANATMGNRVNFSHLALGDGNGSVPTLNETRSSLVKERHRLALNSVDINPNNRNQIICETIVPSSVGGFTVRELGLYVGNTLVMHSTYPPTYKPRQDEGGAREMVIRVVINVQNADVIALYLDTSLVYATREWVETNFINHNEVVDTLTSTDTNKPLSAAMGKKLDDEKVSLATAQTITGAKTFSAEIISTSANAMRLKAATRSVIMRFDGNLFYLLKTADGDPSGNWDATRPFTWDLRNNTATLNGNATTATRLQIARNIAITGDGSWNVNFDGSGNASGNFTLANSGVTAGSYNSVTVDSKGRVTRGLTQTHGLVTATTATGIANVATGNANTFLNIVASGVGQTSSVGSSTQVTGTNGIIVSSDTAGKLIISQEIANTLTDTSASKSLSAAQGKFLNETKLGNSGGQHLDGTLWVGQSNAWHKIIFKDTRADANRFVDLEINPAYFLDTNTNVSNTEIKFKFTDATRGNSTARYITFPSINNTNQLVAYQRWVQNGFLAKTDNAPTATKLQTARTINGVAFDGTQNITITDNTKAPTVHRHNWSEIDGKPSTFTPSSHTHSIANITDFDIKELGTENLDSITKWGIYGQGANNQSLTERNYPIPNEAGTLEVLIGTYGLRQRFTTFASHRQFERSRNNTQTGWNAWTELSNTWGAIRGKPSDLAYTSSNVASATKLQTARNIAMTGDGSWNVNFDGSANASGVFTLANSGVTAGSYNSVTVDSKGRVTRGLTQTHGLVTATTATGTANVATGNGNTFLNIVASGVGQTASVGSSTQITGTNGISVSSDTAGKLVITRDSNSPTASKLATARQIALTGAVTGQANFDGSGNVSIPTALKTIQRTARTGTLTPTRNNFGAQTVALEGSVDVYPDGRIVQYFTFTAPVTYFHRHGLQAFYRTMIGNASFIATEDQPLLEIPLWTAMPNKVIEARMHLSSSTSFYGYGEAAEWSYDWDSIFNQHKNIKDKAYFYFRRQFGQADEPVTFNIIVEGY